jgi:BirA family biotin operon repressor/biotin-[acetyl-CoA-carboxylase] ligase
MTRTAISPRLAIRIFESTGTSADGKTGRRILRAVPDPEASPQPVPGRFAEVRRLRETDSTNREALDAARAGAADGLVVVADHQKAGRGRLGRTWSAPPGASLLVSVLLRPGLAVEDRHLVVMAAAVAMAEAVAATAGVDATLKWPNDLLVDDRKLAGILAEAAGDAVVVGIGVNVEWSAIPEELVGIATACNLEGGRPTTRDELLDAFLACYEARLADLGATAVEYRARLGTIGRKVRVERADGNLVGTATGVDDHGRLLVTSDDGTTEAIAAGDVVHLRAADAP